MKKYIYLFLMFLLFFNSYWRPLNQSEIKYLREKIVETAISFIGKRSIIVNNRRYNFDCSSFVLAVMEANRIKIFEKQAVNISGANGVRIIYETLKKYNRIFKNFKLANKGDLIFFNNTYDKNMNGIWDDILTHIAIVVGIDKFDTIKYIHISGRGVEYGYLNLKFPDKYSYNGEIINSFLRRGRNIEISPKFLSSNLFFCFGKIFK
jgi:hypothetical protein